MSRPVPRLLLGLAALLLVAVASGTARADSFVLNGTTQLSFTCAQSIPCSTSGNSVTFGTGADTTTFTFSGSILDATITNTATTVTMGSVQTSITGAGYVAPLNSAGRESPLGRLTITLNQTSPAPATRITAPVLAGGPDNYRLTFGSNFGFGETYLTTPTGSLSYPLLVFNFNFNPASVINLPAGTTTIITAQVVAVPEPATLLLLATGLGGAALKARRRGKA